MPFTLPPNPATVRLLKDDESKRLRALYSDLPVSPKNCPTCLGKKSFRWKDDSGQPADFTCDCKGQWVLHRFLLNSGIGKRYQRLGWLDAAGVDIGARDAVLDYCDHASTYVSSGRGLILHGEGRGTGKTMLATLLLKTMLVAGHDGYFTQFNEMLDGYSATWRDADERRWFVKRVKNAGVLVVDDVGREHKGRMEVSESLFDDVIRARVRDCRPTILTTNLTLEALEAGYSSNVMSLLREVSYDHLVQGEDFRPRQREIQAQEDALGLVRPLMVA